MTDTRTMTTDQTFVGHIHSKRMRVGGKERIFFVLASCGHEYWLATYGGLELTHIARFDGMAVKLVGFPDGSDSLKVKAIYAA